MNWVEGFSSWRPDPSSRSFAKQIASRCLWWRWWFFSSFFPSKNRYIWREERRSGPRCPLSCLWMETFLDPTLIPNNAEERRVGVGTGMLCCEAGYNKWGFAPSKLLLSVVKCHVTLACEERISGILNEEGGIDAHLDFLFSKFFSSPKYFLPSPEYFFFPKFPAGFFFKSSCWFWICFYSIAWKILRRMLMIWLKLFCFAFHSIFDIFRLVLEQTSFKGKTSIWSWHTARPRSLGWPS